MRAFHGIRSAVPIIMYAWVNNQARYEPSAHHTGVDAVVAAMLDVEGHVATGKNW